MLRNQICKFLSFHCRLQGVECQLKLVIHCLFQEQQQRVALSSGGEYQDILPSTVLALVRIEISVRIAPPYLKYLFSLKTSDFPMAAKQTTTHSPSIQ